MATQHPPLPAATRRRRFRLGIALLVSCVALVAWIADLSVSLPMHYETEGWRLAWTGYDVAELGALATTAYCALRDRWALIPASVVTATLLLCDAWFDMALSSGTDDFLISLATALLVEIPTATVLLLVAWRLTRRLRDKATDAVQPGAATLDVALRDAAFGAELRAILDGPSIATLAMIGTDGEPHSRVVGLHREGDALLLSIVAPRQPSSDLAKDAQVSVSVFDLTNPRTAVEIRGIARLLADGERPGPVALAREAEPTPTPLARTSEPPELLDPADPSGIRLVARLFPTAITRLAS
ncbi:pyridoxamine 5'-phosphate oxidase family protein [Pseudofrankia inefficax]|uniref:Pyridoxamine 5'-phosphate oxidase-related FMN-binding protein n=1 Tax=Pseudofrankia inefficax (strain DSM 45817 / CECT 9037 / DDB 130130 / EuI1c) TaxID=298654 RepID=E3JA17_PSEI1|nr:pyridoxamine 5'-phosphate oxidase family protein [Pseudofrankia inefficax]ADP78579.1 pyridoxamine 5'-phosphate oxidase-related FMN-binding protein [Pseudofrankia inefficax]